MNPKHIICSKCGKSRNLGAIRECPHEAVNKRYGKDICYECCLKCKYEYEGYMGRGYCELCDKISGRETVRYKHYWEDGEFKIERMESNE